MRRLVDGRAERVEVRNAGLVLDNGLTIDQSRFAGELAGSLDPPAIGSGPVPAMTRVGSDLATVDDDKGAVAIVLNLVNPALSGGWFGTSVGISGLIKPRGI